MRLPISILVVSLWCASAQAALVNIIETAVNDTNVSTIGAVSTNRFSEIGAIHTTVTAPISWSSYRFTHWSNSGSPGTSFRDAWGRSLNPISFMVSVACTNAAHYLPTIRDSDLDTIPDWYETEYFGDLGRTAADDADGDGITLLAEYTGGTSPLHANARQEGGVSWADSSLITCNLAGYPTYLLRSDPPGPVNQTGVVPPGTVVTTPDLSANDSFGYWTLDGATQQDSWGRALSVFAFTMASSNREAVAYLFTGDGDGDGVPDAYEYRYYGNLSNNAGSDTDGDGLTLLVECNAGSSPIYANTHQEGGVAWVDSGLITCNLAGYPTYLLRSEPPGTVNQTSVVPPGTIVAVPDLSANASFAYWTLDGVRQEDPWGRALSAFNFVMASSDREAVAYLITGDGDGDGVPDAYEQRYYGNLSQSARSDTDNDGITLLDEYGGNTSPIYANSRQEGGVAWVDSALITCDLQAEIVIWHELGFDVADGGTNDFGAAPIGSPDYVTFFIRNIGGQPLTGLTITKSGADATAFNVVSGAVAPVPHNGQTSFTVEFAPASGGSKTAAIMIASNDADEHPFDLMLAGSGATGLTAYQLWAAACGLEGSEADPQAIPFFEGVPNLSKYAFNMNGYTADARVLMAGGGTAGLPCLRVDPGAGSNIFRFEFVRRAGSGLVYTPVVSTTLLSGSWTPLSDEPTILPLSAGWERVIYEEIVDPALVPRIFGRVEIMLP